MFGIKNCWDKEDGKLYRVLNTVTTVIAQYNTVDLDLIAAKVERDGLEPI